MILSMEKLLRIVFKYIVLLSIGGTLYCGCEILWRGYTHWTMFFVGGICFIFCGSLNEIFDKNMPLWKQMAICAFGITLIEFTSGFILNIIMQLHIWDYSNMPLNILGQVCLPFMLLWFILSLVAIVADDWIRYLLFGEEKPHYKLW